MMIDFVVVYLGLSPSKGYAGASQTNDERQRTKVGRESMEKL